MRHGPGRPTVRTRDALAWAVILVVGAVAVAVLALQGGGGMMGGMGGMMGGMALAGILFFVAIAFLVLALVARTAPAIPPPPTMPPPPPAPAASDSPPGPPAAVSAVEAAVVKLLDEDERLLYTRLRDAGEAVLQRDVVAWGTFSAAKVTRLLDRLEKKGLVVRERHGMTNRIRLAYR